MRRDYMNCDNNYCIYWEKGKCRLSGISLDIKGICKDCIYVDLPPDILDLARISQSDKFRDE